MKKNIGSNRQNVFTHILRLLGPFPFYLKYALDGANDKVQNRGKIQCQNFWRTWISKTKFYEKCYRVPDNLT